MKYLLAAQRAVGMARLRGPTNTKWSSAASVAARVEFVADCEYCAWVTGGKKANTSKVPPYTEDCAGCEEHQYQAYNSYLRDRFPFSIS